MHNKLQKVPLILALVYLILTIIHGIVIYSADEALMWSIKDIAINNGVVFAMKLLVLMLLVYNLLRCKSRQSLLSLIFVIASILAFIFGYALDWSYYFGTFYTPIWLHYTFKGISGWLIIPAIGFFAECNRRNILVLIMSIIIMVHIPIQIILNEIIPIANISGYIWHTEMILLMCASSLVTSTKVEDKEGLTLADNTSPRSWLTTLLLCIFLGGFGAHRFYTGRIATGLAQLVTLGGLGIWTFVDFFIICFKKFRDIDDRVVAK
jgi:TM2 domain-containing membrane protein YozV